MRRETIAPRPGWQRRVEEKFSFHFHTPDGRPYWDESACYVFSAAEVDNIERATYALHDMCLELVQRVIDERMFGLFLVPKEFEQLVIDSWEADEPFVYGRFDLAVNGVDAPKLLEYNADTPTSLYEAAVIQWDWLTDTTPGGNQFNSIHDRLIEAWRAVREGDPGGHLHVCAMADNIEDLTTAEYLRDTAIQAGWDTTYLNVEEVGWDAGRRRFVDRTGREITRCFKLYPWEWMVRDQFGRNLVQAPTRWVEPPWKMILSSKSVLPLLHQMYPDSPFLLPAWFDEPAGDHVRKPVHAREGANVRVVKNGRVVIDTDGPYEGPFVYQQLAPLPAFDGRYPVVGSWVVNGWACGVGVREDDQLVTRNTSRFVPHRMSD